MAELFRVAFFRLRLYFHLPVDSVFYYVDHRKAQPLGFSEA
jgi:hypothetical protein